MITVYTDRLIYLLSVSCVELGREAARVDIVDQDKTITAASCEKLVFTAPTVAPTDDCDFAGGLVEAQLRRVLLC